MQAFSSKQAFSQKLDGSRAIQSHAGLSTVARRHRLAGSDTVRRLMPTCAENSRRCSRGFTFEAEVGNDAEGLRGSQAQPRPLVNPLSRAMGLDGIG